MDETKAFPEDFPTPIPWRSPMRTRRSWKVRRILKSQTLSSEACTPVGGSGYGKTGGRGLPVMPQGDSLSETPAQAAEEAAAGISPAPAPDPNITLQEEIKTKLIYLKELLDEGLITETDYNAKKDALLEKLD
ncbi:MAG: SHOCT domain-containing protein [Desulfobacterales bacterium]